VRVRAAINEMETNPFQGDIKYLAGQFSIRRRGEIGEFSFGWIMAKNW
jgi:hypothetical protein